MIKVLFPGSFDPITKGHLNIIQRASKIYDEIIIGIGENKSKKYLFSLNKRIELIKENTKNIRNIRIVKINKLTVDLAKELNVNIILRGIRNNSDYEYEKNIAEINNKLGNIETIFLLAKPEYQYISSSILKEIYLLNGDISKMVPQNVEIELKKSLK